MTNEISKAKSDSAVEQPRRRMSMRDKAVTAALFAFAFMCVVFCICCIGQMVMQFSLYQAMLV